jgi:hypothetical protein
MRTNEDFESPEPILTVRGDFGDGLSDMVANKVTAIARYAHAPVLAIRVGLDRLADPAVTRPVAARVTVDLPGRKVHSSAIASTARDAMDLAVGRVTDQLDDRPATRRRRRAARRRE